MVNQLSMSLLLFICISPILADNIPVFMWEMNNENRIQVKNPASLYSVNKTVFEAVLLNQLEQNKTVVVFLEKTLCQEDLILRYKGGRTVFPWLTNFVTLSNVWYLPCVEDPLQIIETHAEVMENISVSSILKKPKGSKAKLIIVDLMDTNSNGSREDMFNRHDNIIHQVQSAFLKIQEEIFGVYTARHTSWVVPESSEHFKSKKLLQTNSPSNKTLQNVTVPASRNKSSKAIIDDKNLLLVVSGAVKYSKNGGQTFSSISLGQSDFSIADKKLKFSLQGGNLTVSFSIVFSSAHWSITEISMNEKNASFESVEASVKYSYHCSKFKVENHKTRELLIIPGFQIQPFKNGLLENPTFGIANDCTGFTTIIIWNAIFVVAVLLSILFFGIACTMDITTMDRFEDPQQKPFHVNPVD